MVREKKGRRERHMVNFFVHIKLRIIINSKLPSEIVNSYITLYWGEPE